MKKDELEKNIMRRLGFKKGFLNALAGLAGAGITTRDYKLPHFDAATRAKKVNDALAGDWARVGSDMQSVIDRHKKEHKKD